MKVVCSGCGAEYRVDATKINGAKAWFKCKGCSENIIVEKEDILDTFYPVENPEVDDLFFDGDTDTGQRDESASEHSENPVTEPESATASPAPNQYAFGLTTKVIFLMLLVSLIPGGIFFALSSKYSHERILAETDRTGTMVANQAAGRVDEWMDKNIRALKAAACMPDIQSMDAAAQTVLLKTIQREYPWMYLIYTADLTGFNTARSDDAPLKDYSGRQYVQEIINGAELSWQNLMGKTSLQPVLVLAVPIVRDGKTVGLLAGAMTRTAISEQVTRFKLGNSGSGFLVDNNDKTVAHQNNAFVLKQKSMSAHPLIKAAKEDRHGSIEFTDADGKTAIGFTAQTAMGWTLAVQQYKDEALAPLKRARNSAIMLMGVTLAVVFLIALLASRSLVMPIKELTHAANRISVGDMNVEIKTRSNNEIGDLADAITRLQDSIKISIARIQRLKN